MIEDGAFYRWPPQSPPENLEPHKAPGDIFDQTISGQGQLFDSKVGAPEQPLSKALMERQADAKIINEATRRKVARTSLHGVNGGEATQQSLINEDHPSMRPRREPPRPKKPRGRTSNRVRALADARAGIPFGEQ